ncbi:hypothetical protein HAX54_045117, partial [Datura stramonium]|nr:hypothetical protein [Datura stramonium]
IKSALHLGEEYKRSAPHFCNVTFICEYCKISCNEEVTIADSLPSLPPSSGGAEEEVFSGFGRLLFFEAES